LNICLLSRYFDTNHTEGVGIGRVSEELYKQLVKGNDYILPLASRPGGLLTYFIYSSLLIPLDLRGQKFDIYHALTPIESFWIPKNKSLVTINDLFSLINVKGMGSGLQGNTTLMKLAQFYYLKACESAVECNKLVCISEKTKEDIIRVLRVKPEKIKVIRPGISNSLEPIALQHKEFTIGYIGALDNRKRVQLLIKAFIDSNIQGRLLIGGQGLEELKLKELSGNSPNIVFLGYIPEDKINNFYSLLDLLIFPTSMEGYGLPLVEAMACGVPPVVLEDSDIPLEIKDRCIIVKDLTRFLMTVEKYPNLLKEVDLKDNLKFAKTHRWEETAKEYYKLYEEIQNG